MEYREIGTSGLQVSAIGLGCNNFGFYQDAKQAQTCISRALEEGITLFDMASEHGMGLEEELVGAALGAHRRDVVIATKFGQQELVGLRSDGGMEFSTDLQRQGASRRWIMQSVEESLKRLKTDYIDLYQLHVIDPQVPPEETMRALEDLLQQGKARAIGLAATFASAADLSALQDAAAASGGSQFESMQTNYNMIGRDAEIELLPSLKQRGMSLLPYWPLANGLLAGRYWSGVTPAGDSRLRRIPVVQSFYNEEDWARVEKIRLFAEGRQIAMAELALAWLLSRPVVASVIAGASRPEQVGQNARSAERRLSEVDLSELESLLT